MEEYSYKEFDTLRIIRITAAFIALTAVVGALTRTTFNTVDAKPTLSAFQDRDPMKPLQHVVASKTAKFDLLDS
jgi:hypothetical protein